MASIILIFQLKKQTICTKLYNLFKVIEVMILTEGYLNLKPSLFTLYHAMSPAISPSQVVSDAVRGERAAKRNLDVGRT